MANYYSVSCSYCGHVWRPFKIGIQSNLGPAFIKCRNCKNVNRTGLQLYRDWNWFGKLMFILGRIFLQLLMGSGMMVAGIYALSQGVDSQQNIWETIIIYVLFIILIVFGAYKMLSFFLIPKEIKDTASLVDKNGGYAWSDEWYGS